MAVRVPVTNTMLTWAQERSGLTREKLITRFPAFPSWEEGAKQPTLKQLEEFARLTHTPIGYMFASEPPQEHLPISDFRTFGELRVKRASPDLLDTVYLCQRRQEWYRDYARNQQEPRISFFGTFTVDMDIRVAAARMRAVLSFGTEERGSTWSEALRRLIDQAESLGILVMVSGIVGSDTHRKLDPQEFRGFALADEVAPVVFVNGCDTKAAQIFTLAHELAHIWLGESAVDDPEMSVISNNLTERWCNDVSGEFLLPAAALQDVSVDRDNLTEQLDGFASRFKVSTLVALRRLFDTNKLAWPEYRSLYADERTRILNIMEQRSSNGGGDFYSTQPMRVSKRFARALIESTREGNTLYRDAFQMLGFNKVATFNQLAQRLRVG